MIYGAGYFIGLKFLELEERLRKFYQDYKIRTLSERDAISCEYLSGRLNVVINDYGYITHIYEG